MVSEAQLFQARRLFLVSVTPAKRLALLVCLPSRQAPEVHVEAQHASQCTLTFSFLGLMEFGETRIRFCTHRACFRLTAICIGMRLWIPVAVAWLNLTGHVSVPVLQRW